MTSWVSILQERIAHSEHILNEQLSHALDSRILIEQAKGVIAHSRSIPMDEAFLLLRQHSRNHNLSIRDVAARITNFSLEAKTLVTRIEHRRDRQGGQGVPLREPDLATQGAD